MIHQSFPKPNVFYFLYKNFHFSLAFLSKTIIMSTVRFLPLCKKQTQTRDTKEYLEVINHA